MKIKLYKSLSYLIALTALHTSQLFSYEIYLGDLHAHTVFSDGGKSKKLKNDDGKLGFKHDPKATPKFAWEHAKKSNQGDFLAITDHHSRPEQWGKPENNLSAEEWEHIFKYSKELTDSSFLAIQAVETSRPWGHMNTFFGQSLIDANTTNLALDYFQLLLNTHSHTTSSFNHTNAYGKKKNDFNNFKDYDSKLDKVISLFEVISGKHVLEEEYLNALNQGWKVGAIGVSDTHSMNWLTGYQYRTGVLSKSLDKNDFVKALKARRVYATQNKNLKISFMINGAIMGREIKSDFSKLSAHITVWDPDKNEKDKIQMIEIIDSNGEPIYSKSTNQHLVNLKTKLEKPSPYYYLKVTNQQGHLAFTAPIWVEESYHSNYLDTVKFDGYEISGGELLIK